MSKKKQSKKLRKTPVTKSDFPQPFWKNKAILLPLLGVLVLTAIAFMPSLSNDFVNWDDDVNIIDNQYISALNWENVKAIFTTRVIGNYNPLPIFTFAIEHHFVGLDPTLYHINNLLLHLLVVFFVYRVSLQLGMKIWVAALVALLFGIHPMRVESVAWATERKDVLFGAFYFAAIWSYLKYIKTEKQQFYVITLVLFVLSLFSKIQAVALPLSLIAIDYYLKKPLKLGFLINKIPFFVLSLAFGLYGIYGLGSDGSLEDATNYSILERLAVGAYTYCVYLIKFVFPYEMSPLYPYQATMPTRYYAGFLGVIAMIVAFFWAMKKGHRTFVFGIAFFTFNVMFMLQILGAGQGLLADRFTYVGYFGLFFLLAKGLFFFMEKNPIKANFAKYGMIVYLVIFGIITFQQTKIWKNGLVMWSHVNKLYPETPTPLANMGHYYRDRNNYAKAVELYEKSIQQAPRAETYNSLGKIHFENNNPQKAIESYNLGVQTIASDKTLAEIYANRGTLFGSQGRMDDALANLNKSIELNPKHENAYAMRSMVYFQRREYERALADYDAVIALGSPSADIVYEKGLVLNELGRFQDALTSLNRAIAMNPNNGLYYAERAKSFVETGNKTAAQQDAQKAQSLGKQVQPAILQKLQ